MMRFLRMHIQTTSFFWGWKTGSGILVQNSGELPVFLVICSEICCWRGSICVCISCLKIMSLGRTFLKLPRNAKCITLKLEISPVFHALFFGDGVTRRRYHKMCAKTWVFSTCLPKSWVCWILPIISLFPKSAPITHQNLCISIPPGPKFLQRDQSKQTFKGPKGSSKSSKVTSYMGQAAASSSKSMTTVKVWLSRENAVEAWCSCFESLGNFHEIPWLFRDFRCDWWSMDKNQITRSNPNWHVNFQLRHSCFKDLATWQMPSFGPSPGPQVAPKCANKKTPSCACRVEETPPTRWSNTHHPSMGLHGYLPTFYVGFFMVKCA